MDNKWLVIQSFQQNQELLNDISKLLIYFKLYDTGIDDRLSDEEVKQSKESVNEFLDKISDIALKIEKKDAEPLFGVDRRLKHLAQSFVEAKGKKNKFKSILFRKNISEIKKLIEAPSKDETENIITSLSELRNLLEDQITIDSKEIISDF
jgi:hypothetical protein